MISLPLDAFPHLSQDTIDPCNFFSSKTPLLLNNNKYTHTLLCTFSVNGTGQNYCVRSLTKGMISPVILSVPEAWARW